MVRLGESCAASQSRRNNSPAASCLSSRWPRAWSQVGGDSARFTVTLRRPRRGALSVGPPIPSSRSTNCCFISLPPRVGSGEACPKGKLVGKRKNQYGYCTDRLETGMINRIRDIRREKGLTLADVAERCDPPTTAQTIGRLETGMRQLSLTWMNRIATALSVDPELLVRGQEAAQPRLVARLL